MDDRMTFLYQPLVEPDAIRLIILQPDKDIDARVQCSMVHTTLTECDDDVVEHYSALSYVWGDPRITTPIFVDDYEIDITVNLESALRHMRDSSRPRRVWADGVCINQSDAEEKNRQVSQMRDVYKLAKHTIIYLGDETRETDELLQKIRLRTFSADGDNSRAFLSLFSRPWFTRVWIFQELIMSQDPWVQCGANRVRWHQLLKAFVDGVEANLEEEPWKTVLWMDRAREAFRPGKDYDGSNFTGSLLDTLDSRRGFGVSDPRDMLFANLGVLGKADGGPELTPLVEVAYDKSHAEVYKDIGKYVISMRGGYSVLSFCETPPHEDEDELGNQNPTGTPSWAPNWMLKSFPHPYRRLRECLGQMRHNRYFENWGDGRSFPSSEGSGPNFPRVLTDLPCWIPPDIMACPGRILGRVTSVSQPISLEMASYQSPYLSIRTSTIRLFYNHWQHMIGPLLKYEGVDTTEVRLMKLGLDNEAFLDISNRFLERLEPFVSWREAEEEAPGKEALSPQNLLNHMMILFTDRWLKPDYPQFLYGRKFAALGERKLALVPAKAQEGDIVCSFDGEACTTFLLRRREAVTQKEHVNWKIKETFRKYGGVSFKIAHCDFVGECFAEDEMPWLGKTSFPNTTSPHVVFALH